MKTTNFSKLLPSIFKALSIVIVLAILAAALPLPAQAEPADAPNAYKCTKYYTVKKNDTVASIAARFGQPTSYIASINGLKKPYSISPGDYLCVATNEYPSTTGSSTGSGGFTASLRNNKVTISGSGFKKNQAFFVRVSDPSSGRGFKIGRVDVKNNGTISGTFSLPKDLGKIKWLSVCLKNISTDALSCRLVVPK